MCGCKSKKPTSSSPSSLLTSSGNFNIQEAVITGDEAAQMVKLEYVGPREQNFRVNSRIDRDVSYKFGNNPLNKERAVYLADAEWMMRELKTGERPDYRIVTNGKSVENRDPSAALNMPIGA